MGKKHKKLGRPKNVKQDLLKIDPSEDQLFLEEMKNLENVHPKDVDLSIDASNTNLSQTNQDGPLQIDLHGLTAEEAKARVHQTFSRLMSQQKVEVLVRVITGKGRHSGPEGGVLVREIHAFVKQEYGNLITKLDPSPTEATISGLPVRGHFDVILKLPKKS